ECGRGCRRSAGAAGGCAAPAEWRRSARPSTRRTCPDSGPRRAAPAPVPRSAAAAVRSRRALRIVLVAAVLLGGAVGRVLVLEEDAVGGAVQIVILAIVDRPEEQPDGQP